MGLTAKMFGKNKSMMKKFLKDCKTTKEYARKEVKTEK